IAYSFTKSRNSILLAKYVTGFCTSRSTGRGGAETVRAAFRSRAAPPPGRTPPPPSHTLPLFPHLGAHRIPQPHFRTPPPLARSTLRPGCASPCSHTLRASAVCFPGCTAHRSVPLPFARRPLACSPPLTRGPFARGPLACPPLCGPPIARTPVPPVLPVCAQEGWRACGRGGARGRGAARVEGTAH